MTKALKTDIRELIFIRDLQPEEQRGSAAGLADAIIALLQPRMLTKDEAKIAYRLCRCLGNAEYPIFTCDAFIVEPLVAKLKLIQEEDSE